MKSRRIFALKRVGHDEAFFRVLHCPDAELAQREAIKVSVVTEMFHMRRHHDRKRYAVLVTEPFAKNDYH